MGNDTPIVAVEFVAEVRNVRTMADGTTNVTLNLPEYCIDQATWFLKHHRDMVKSVSALDVKIDDNGRKSNKPESNY